MLRHHCGWGQQQVLRKNGHHPLHTHHLSYNPQEPWMVRSVNLKILDIDRSSRVQHKTNITGKQKRKDENYERFQIKNPWARWVCKRCSDMFLLEWKPLFWIINERLQKNLFCFLERLFYTRIWLYKGISPFSIYVQSNLQITGTPNSGHLWLTDKKLCTKPLTFYGITSFISGHLQLVDKFLCTYGVR